MDDAKQQLANKLKSANNILVTVSRDPSVDQLAGCIGLTLLLNKQGKHTAAVFSGEVPSTLEFLKPEDTLEKNTNSLRDFIIALDKSKADKLRYKVEDNTVRIFITPYKTSISQADLDFSEGDFNVDVVVALGVAQQEDLDEAITAHGRILHDATVTSINISPDGGLGSINWNDPQASSLSELVTELAQHLGSNLLDAQVATALLTGIVSETDRFSNDKTSSQTMSISAALMAAGANQQLVASKLEESSPAVLSDHPNEDNNSPDKDPSGDMPSDKPSDGTIVLKHDEQAEVSDQNFEQPPPGNMSADDKTSFSEDTSDDIPASSEKAKPGKKKKKTSKPAASDVDSSPPEVDKTPIAADPNDSNSGMSPGPKLVTEPPSMGGTLTANSAQEKLDPVTDPFSVPSSEHPKLFERKNDTLSTTNPPESPHSEPKGKSSSPASTSPVITPTPILTSTPVDAQDFSSTDQPINTPEPSLIELEESAKSPTAKPADLESVRDDIDRALSTSAATEHEQPEPIDALNAQPLGDDLHPYEAASVSTTEPASTPAPGLGPAPADDQSAATSSGPKVDDPNAPPPVPPPIPFQFGAPPPPQ